MQNVLTGRVMVTGSAGFVGSALARRLGPDFIPCDVKIGVPMSAFSDSNKLDGVETVVHLAATQYFTEGIPLHKYEPFHEGNVVEFEKLLDACVGHGVRKFVHISTDMVYGPQSSGRGIREDDPLEPVGHYGRSKVEAEKMLKGYAGKIPVITVIRPRVIGGAGRGGLFAMLTKLVKRRLPVPMFGRGDNLFQMTHVEDLADLLKEAIDRDVPGTFNVGSTQISTMREKVGVVGRCCGVKPLIVSVPNSLAVGGCSLLYRLFAGPLQPEQFRMAGLPFVLSLENTFANFHWRPSRSDNEVVEDSVKALLATL